MDLFNAAKKILHFCILNNQMSRTWERYFVTSWIVGYLFSFLFYVQCEYIFRWFLAMWHKNTSDCNIRDKQFDYDDDNGKKIINFSSSFIDTAKYWKKLPKKEWSKTQNEHILEALSSSTIVIYASRKRAKNWTSKSNCA